MKKHGFNLPQKTTTITILLIVVIGFLTSCSASKPYNTVYDIKAVQIIRGASYLTGYEEHVISDKDGNVYRIFQTPNIPNDSIYNVVKRQSFNRELSMQYYYKIVKLKKVKK